MRRGQKRFHTEGKVWKRLGNHSADRQDEAINPLAQYGFRAEERSLCDLILAGARDYQAMQRSLCDLILAGARDYQAMQPAVERHAKVVKVVAPDPRSRSSSSVSNDSADDEDNEDNGVRNCQRYMSPARKVVKVAAPDPRSRSSSSFSNDSAEDEDNGVRNCRRYMSPVSRRQYPGTAHSDIQAILAQRNSAFQSGSEVPNPALAYAELDDAEELQAIVNKCFHCVTLPSLQEVFFPSV